MVVKYMIGNMKVCGPPYTKEEEADFYSRFGNGSVTMFPGTNAKRSAPPPASKPAAKKKPRPRRRAADRK